MIINKNYYHYCVLRYIFTCKILLRLCARLWLLRSLVRIQAVTGEMPYFKAYKYMSSRPRKRYQNLKIFRRITQQVSHVKTIMICLSATENAMILHGLFRSGPKEFFYCNIIYKKWNFKEIWRLSQRFWGYFSRDKVTHLDPFVGQITKRYWEVILYTTAIWRYK